MQRLLFISFMAFFAISINAQVGIGTTDPHPAAELDIRSEEGTRGIIIPSVEEVEDVRIDTISDIDVYNRSAGLMVFQTSDSSYYFWNGESWQCATPFITNQTTGVVTNSTTYPDANLNGSFSGTVNGNLDASGTNSFSGNGTIPLGGIIMWSGSTTDLPPGWVLCDGTSTYRDFRNTLRTVPNLSGKFIVSFDAESSTTPISNPNSNQENYGWVGNIGGEREVRLLAAQCGVPKHTHRVQGTTQTDGNHVHSARNGYSTTENGKNHNRYPASRGGNPNPNDIGLVTKNDGAHNHTINFISQDNAAKSATSSHENRPPYYVLAFIIRVQ